jgi:NAD(P)-dependent dehydrogenase (short-subunit alcohol dehydrogenase family)
MAVEFNKRGWKVAGGARNEEALDNLKKEIGGSCFFDTVDVSKSEEVEKFAQSVEEKLGVPNLLVNNAGIINKNAPLTQVPPEEFANVISINLGGIHNMIRSFVPRMEKRGNGIIVNFSSYWGQSTAPEVGPYCTTKWGVEGLTRSLAQELPQGLAAVAFNPGIINTDMLRSCFGDGASSHENPANWARYAVDRLEKIGLPDNGQTIIGQP